ncbi:MAG: PHP domain-containing protein [Hyphomicrobiaceae bacterium]|nr:MAG: PHP domain-containing protein [Hyphomicrobiaceae bacterium]
MNVLPFARRGNFWRGNLHTHSTRSDGKLAPAAVAEFYRDAGYDFLAITDHFWECYGYPVTDTRDLRRKGFTTIIGAEMHAPITSKNHDWHLVAAGLPLDFAPWTSGETIQSMCRRAHAAGAFLGIAHPQWYGLTTEDALCIPEAHAVEIYNHSCAVECDRGDGLVVFEEVLETGRRINAYAADDAHFSTPDAGGGWVMVKAEALEPELLIEALKRGDFYSSQGPKIHDIAIKGDEVTVACSPASWIVAVGAGTGSRAAHGRDLTCATLPLDAFGEDGHFRITVTDDKGRRAWSNPIWR